MGFGPPLRSVFKGGGWAIVTAALLLQGCGGDSPFDPPEPDPPEPAQLAFVTEPDTVEGQMAFDPAPRVAVQDSAGNTLQLPRHA